MAGSFHVDVNNACHVASPVPVLAPRRHLERPPVGVDAWSQTEERLDAIVVVGDNQGRFYDDVAESVAPDFHWAGAGLLHLGHSLGGHAEVPGSREHCFATKGMMLQPW